MGGTLHSGMEWGWQTWSCRCLHEFSVGKGFVCIGQGGEGGWGELSGKAF